MTRTYSTTPPLGIGGDSPTWEGTAPDERRDLAPITLSTHGSREAAFNSAMADREGLYAALKALHSRYVTSIGSEDPEALAAQAAILRVEA